MFMIVCNEKLLRELFEEFTRRTEREIRKGFEELARAIAQKRPAVSARLIFKNAKGEIEPMAKSVLLTDAPGSYLYQEFAADGSVVAPTGTVQYASDAPAVATIDPTSGQLTYVSAGTANISASDSGNLPATDALTIGPGTTPPPVAVSSTLTFVPPAAPAPAAGGAAPSGNAASSSRSSHA